MKTVKIILTIVITLCAGVTVWTQQSKPNRLNSAELIQLARHTSFQARAGNFGIVPKAVSQLEEATAANPNNSELWRALGDLYAVQAASAVQPGGKLNLPEALSAFQRASGAYERALQIDPNNAFALSGHGTLLAIFSAIQQKPELATKAVAELNRAVELSPATPAPRLNRAFSVVNLPPQLRNTQVITEDLNFLLQIAEGSRAGDMVHILLGDLYVETGKADFARKQYESAATPSSKAREEALARLAALERGSVPAAEIKRLRSNLKNCMMCHAK